MDWGNVMGTGTCNLKATMQKNCVPDAFDWRGGSDESVARNDWTVIGNLSQHQLEKGWVLVFLAHVDLSPKSGKNSDPVTKYKANSVSNFQNWQWFLFFQVTIVLEPRYWPYCNLTWSGSLPVEALGWNVPNWVIFHSLCLLYVNSGLPSRFPSCYHTSLIR